MRNWIKTVTVLMFLSLVACDRDEPSLGTVNYLAYGSSFGECLGYCNHIMKVYPQAATLSIFSWQESGEYPDKQCTLPLESYEFISIRDSVDVGNFFSLDEVYGCPDCADGGAEWVEISFDTMKHRVTFEYLHEPEELTPIVTALRELASAFDECQ